MTSDIEQGPELFETPQPVVAERPSEQKPVRKVVRRRSPESTQPVVMRIRQSSRSSSPEQASEAERAQNGLKTEEPQGSKEVVPGEKEPQIGQNPVRKRGRPSRKTAKNGTVQPEDRAVSMAAADSGPGQQEVMPPGPPVEMQSESDRSVKASFAEPVVSQGIQDQEHASLPPVEAAKPSAHAVRVRQGSNRSNQNSGKGQSQQPQTQPQQALNYQQQNQGVSQQPQVQQNQSQNQQIQGQPQTQSQSQPQASNQNQGPSQGYVQNPVQFQQSRNQSRTQPHQQGKQPRNKMQHGKNNQNFQQNRPLSPINKNNQMQIEDFILEPMEDNPDIPRIVVNDLTAMAMSALRQTGIDYGVSQEMILDLRRQELIVEILKAHASAGGIIMAYGSLEILPDGYGFLRSPQNNYLSGPEDVYISSNQIKMLSLKTGDTVEGQIRSPRDAERFFAMIRVKSINYDPPAAAKTRASFDSLTPLYPDVRLNLETDDGEVSTRIINLFCPIGKGQRSLIVAPPRAGKTILMQKIANAISANHPEVYLMVLLIDERPEEVTDMRRTVKGEVIASTFDEQATRHVSVAEMVIEKAKRLVEHKRDVVILLDNITRLARAYNQTVPASGKILSGGVDSNALHKPKRFLGAARNIEHGGSLTIIASALIETGSRMDEVIFEEFKGTGNNEIVLDRRMAERRLFPALNIKKSGTRREDLLLSPEENAKIWALRNAINPLEDIDMTDLLIDKMRKTKNNEAFLRSMNTGIM